MLGIYHPPSNFNTSSTHQSAIPDPTLFHSTTAALPSPICKSHMIHVNVSAATSSITIWWSVSGIAHHCSINTLCPLSRQYGVCFSPPQIGVCVCDKSGCTVVAFKACVCFFCSIVSAHTIGISFFKPVWLHGPTHQILLLDISHSTTSTLNHTIIYLLLHCDDECVIWECTACIGVHRIVHWFEGYHIFGYVHDVQQWPASARPELMMLAAAMVTIMLDW